MTAYTTYEELDVPSPLRATAVAEAIAEAFYDPAVVRVAVESDSVLHEFDATDIGHIRAVDGRVAGLVRETMPVHTVDAIRVQREPWLPGALQTLDTAAREQDGLAVSYVSRFGGTEPVTKEITVTNGAAMTAQEPYGVDTGDGQIASVSVLGHMGSDDLSIVGTVNGGVTVEVNDTQVVEEQTVPTFERRDNHADGQ